MEERCDKAHQCHQERNDGQTIDLLELVFRKICEAERKREHEERTRTVDNGDGTYSVKPAEQKPSNNYYYYSPSTTTTDTTKGSPKTFDAGVGIYAVTALLSVTGMAWAGKKRH